MYGKDVQINSKLVKQGDIFVAVPCADLNEHIDEAIRNGASIVYSEGSDHLHVVNVDDARLFASFLAKKKYGKQPERCIAVTGTNGKSSVCHFLTQIWRLCGYKAANLGTLGLFIGNEKCCPDDIVVPNLTTPDTITLHKIMEYLYYNKVNSFAFEASSHALIQKRLHNVDLNAAAFTNLASDHLDYHKTKEAYFKAKSLLFEEILPSEKPIVISRDYAEIYDKIAKPGRNVISFGLDKKNLIRAENIKEYSQFITFDLLHKDKKFKEIRINLLGNFQVMNILCAAALAYATNIKIEDIVQTLSQIKPLNGRMERVCSVNGGDVYIDFAHTAEGFKKAISCFKKVCRGRLICVFGCGGDRDQSKRPIMGKIAASIADVAVVTDDNPRTEDPAKIRAEIIKECPKAIEIANRANAIKYAMDIIQPGDLVAIMGKGHEEYQIYSDKTTRFNDKEEVLKLAE
ncbi:MAG: UDP-N-acetylmuramoyl-L-alanyl-D-glutamate--2,6-diaminopimelate ligase [Holosporales bacterium]|jgi:UDP-N-acetylmuramoyl-L-alanyl-D-glutamate--2,6-diaminopimelate ligase|nr:UDP-N-acetylmuramoyl-L-alanyl-D-glutamate--2,6-diaminopimelate ligase [Holosporales bacterium]